jgi:DNA (cytosine-5)-methyltransferase 1
MDKTAIELFAGVGGFHLGLSKSGWKVIWANQWEPGKKQQWAFECYKRHFEGSGTTCINEDINEVPTQDIPPATLLVGGFPCQDYSVATTNAHGIEGKKGVLWWHIERILRENIERGTPIPFVLLENVDRLVRSPAKQRGRDFGIILSCLNNLGYVVEWRVLNASEYGYPQKRRRTFIFATLSKSVTSQLYDDTNDMNIITKHGFFATEFPCKPNGDANGTSICLWPDLVKMTEQFAFDFQNAGYMKDGRIFTIRVIPTFTWDKGSGKGTLRSVLEEKVDEKYIIPIEWIGDERDRGTEAFRKTWRYCKGAKDESRVHKNGHSYRYNEGKIPFPDKLDEPSRTMLTSEGNLRPNRIGHIIPVDESRNLYRVLTPVEAERLNGFDDGWTEGMPEGWRYFCMGNALVVGLVEQMGRRLGQIMHEGVGAEDQRVGGTIVGPLDAFLEPVPLKVKRARKRRSTKQCHKGDSGI